MDKQDYLDKISASSKPMQAKKKGFWHSIYFKLIAGSALALIVLMIIGSILSNGRPNVKSEATALKLHLDATIEMISTYQTDVKSSDLRSSSASLRGVLSNTDSDVTSFLETNYQFREKDAEERLLTEASANKEELNNDLFSAKINGILDRIYAHKMAYEISLFMAEESTLIKMLDGDDLAEKLNTSYNSLNNLYSKFNDFSETK